MLKAVVVDDEALARRAMQQPTAEHGGFALAGKARSVRKAAALPLRRLAARRA